MKKVILQYDAATQTIYDIGGIAILAWANLNYEEVAVQQGSAVVDFHPLSDLKEKGFTADEIIKFHREGLL